MEAEVLVVDDEPALLTEVAEYLEPDCGAVLTAASGQDALRLLLAHRSLRVVVLDLRMPGMSGFELIELVRTQRRDGLPRFIIITGHAGPAEQARAQALGVDDFLDKPFDLEALRSAVMRSLEGTGRRAPFPERPQALAPEPAQEPVRSEHYEWLRLEARVDALETQLRKVLAELRDLKAERR